MPEPSTTFVVPCHNAGDHLEPLLESLLSQSSSDFALILADDASTDGSVAKARALAADRIEIHVSGERLGIAANWNRAVALARTPFVCIAHQDDLYHPEYLATMLAALEGDARAGLVHCRARSIDENGQEIRSPIEVYKERFWTKPPTDDRAAAFRMLYHGNFICCSSILYRSDALGAAGPFAADLEFTLDWQMHLRMLLAGWGIAGVRQGLVSYRRHRGSATRDAIRSLRRYREEVRVLEWARAEGIRAGLLGRDTQTSPAVRNNLLYDAYDDLRAGRRSEARQKLAFGRREIPGFAEDLLARAVATCARLGFLGAHLLRAGLWLYLRFGPRRVS